MPIVEDVQSESSNDVASPRPFHGWSKENGDAVRQMNKSEKEYALKDRQRVLDLQRFILSKGFSLEEVDTSIQLNDKGFFQGPLSRNEFGLPNWDVNVGGKTEGVMPMAADVKGPECGGGSLPETIVKKSWTQVVNSAPPQVDEVKFEYIPLPEGATTVTPPDEVLKKGVDKFRNCIVGVFTKGALSFNTVNDLANKLWGGKGLLQVFQKSSTTFFFKFDGLASKSAILARGTVLFYRRPLVLSDWGVSVGEQAITTLPIWVKLSNVPDCYWTKEGLSNIASVLGPPICADKLTSKLEILPFARMCVNYKIGDPLPDSIPVIAIGPSGGKFVEKVLVEYAHKPLICSGCKVLGHPISACSLTKKVWVQKKVQPSFPIMNSNGEGGLNDVKDSPDSTLDNKDSTNPSTHAVFSTDASPLNPVHDDEGAWQEVVRKRRHSPCPGTPAQSSPGSASPAMPLNFRHVIIDEVAKKLGTLHSANLAAGSLSKSQRKKLRKSGRGDASPRN
ncbi:hypothetical protein POM88_054753 [Heracleum sosnowskyi]|uniref:DUF4283 domain-containing protein n=1 Tax=Heracleum sosnowskyi TaxID=360622 RepID=A0AAD8LUI1_9APIA|nr:hypothetical protein POM88_054753 [Heracleum sosnowskyi]